jgi:DNA repair exonuclease SbcCD ATPase subunit
MKKKMADLEKQAKPSSGDKKSSEEMQKLQKENKELRKEKEELNKTLKEFKSGKDTKSKKGAGTEKNAVIAQNGDIDGQIEMSEIIRQKTEDLIKLKQNFDSLLKDLESKTAEIEKLTSQLARSKTDCSAAVEKLRKSESELSQIKEKNAQLSDELLNKSRTITAMENSGRSGSSMGGGSEDLHRQVEDLKRKLAEAASTKPKKSVKFSAEPEVLSEPMRPEKMKELEEALAAAYAERHEIIEACRKEVDFHRTIASELESSIMEDFEWKLHEIEKDYNMKLKQSRETMDEQIKEACRGILREKDEEIRKLQVQVIFCCCFTIYPRY